MAERIDRLDIWDKHGHRIIFKVLDMLYFDSYVEEICSWSYDGMRIIVDRILLDAQSCK